MNAKYAFAIVATFSIVTFLSLYFRNILIVVNFLFIAGIVIIIAGFFIASRISHFGVRRAALYAIYPNNPPFDNARRSMKTGLLIIAVGAVMILLSVIIWEFSKHGTF